MAGLSLAQPAAPDFIQVYNTVLARLVGARVEGRVPTTNRLIPRILVSMKHACYLTQSMIGFCFHPPYIKHHAYP